MAPTLASIGQFFGALGNPEYLYLWLEPVLTWGVAFGLMTYIFALITGEKKTQVFGLVIIIASALTIAPYLYQRAAAEQRIVNVYEQNEPQRASGYMGTREERKSKAWIYYLAVFSATMGILVGGENNRMGVTFMISTIIICMLAILVGNSMHYEESRVYHPNLRRDAPSTTLSSGYR